jgi:hypothetical protein
MSLFHVPSLDMSKHHYRYQIPRKLVNFCCCMFYLMQQCNKITTNSVLVPYLKSLLFADALFQCAYLSRSISPTFAWLYNCSDDHKREHLLYMAAE